MLERSSGERLFGKNYCVFGIFFLWERWAADIHKAPVRRSVTKWEEPTIWKTKDTLVSCEPREGSQASAVLKEPLPGASS